VTPTLVVTADDVGLHPATTDGAIQGFDHGIVTACSLVATGPDFGRAVELLRARPGLAVGVHLTLVNGAPLQGAGAVPSLVGRDGRFLPGFAAFLRRYLGGRVRLGEVAAELEAQVERVLATGLPVTHLDGHQHLHVLPEVLGIVLRLAREHGIGALRTPIETRRPGVPAARSASLAVLNILGRQARRRARAAGITTSDHAAGIAWAGHLDTERLLAFIAEARGATELVCHPGTDNTALAAALGWDADWETELTALCDPRVREAIHQSGLALTSPAPPPH
jgi:chitin disaccharide deacetylase